MTLNDGEAPLLHELGAQEGQLLFIGKLRDTPHLHEGGGSGPWLDGWLPGAAEATETAGTLRSGSLVSVTPRSVAGGRPRRPKQSRAG
jgi:hypothetical protein